MYQAIKQTQKELTLNEREQIQYLLGNPPSWMLRYGISVMAFFFFFLTGMSYFMRYPDVIEAKIVLTTANPPIRVLASAGGRISALLVSEGQYVEKGSTLAVVESAANWKDVLHLESWLESNSKSRDSLLTDLKLGSLQSAYSSLCQHRKDYLYFSTSKSTSERIAAIQRQMEELAKINQNLLRQKNISLEAFALKSKERIRQMQLHKENVISDMDFEKSEGAWLQEKKQIEGYEASFLQNQMQVTQLQNQIQELRLVKTDGQNDKELVLAEDEERLKSAIAEWKQTYLIVAPINGNVSLSKIWSVQQSVSGGEEVLGIVPNGAGNEKIIGKSEVSASSISKINLGMRAIIRLDAYPASQYGAVEGIVQNLAALPQEKGYQLDVELPNALRTTYGKSLPFRQEISGTLRVITADRRVISRIFDRLNDLLKNK